MCARRRTKLLAVIVLSVAALLVVGMAQAAEKPTILSPRAWQVAPRVGPLADPGLLTAALADIRPLEIFRPGQIVTPDQLPPATVAWPLVLQTRKLRAGPTLVDLSDKPTDAVVDKRKLTIASDALLRPLELLKFSAAIDGIEAVARGQYNIHFRYSIYDNSIPKPLRFQLYLEGEARPHVCWIPYVHASGGASNLSAYVTALMMGDTTPLMARADKVGVAVVDGAGNSLGVFTRSTGFTFVKRYRDITRDDIKNYMNTASHIHNELPVMNPPVSGAATTFPGNITKVMEINPHVLEVALGAPAVATRLTSGRSILGLQGEYCLEPAMAFVRTNQGNYAKLLVRAEREGSTPYHLAIWDARCYARDQATFNGWPFMSNGSPSNTEYIQLFERGGYLLNTWLFDFDRDGENIVNGQEDVFFQNPSGPNTQKLVPQNGASLAW